MICFSSKLPVLQVGTYQLADYDTSWLRRAIEEGLSSADAEDSSIAEDIYLGVLHYLQNDCPWVPLKIETLYDRINKLCDKIGFSHLQGHIPMISPPVRISVVERVEKLNCPMEIALFQMLDQELNALLPYGVEKVRLDEVKEAVLAMIPAKKWNKRCQLLHDEITALELNFNTTYHRRPFLADRERFEEGNGHNLYQ